MPHVQKTKNRKPGSSTEFDQIGIATRAAVPDDAMNVNGRNESWRPGTMRPFIPQFNFSKSQETLSPTERMMGLRSIVSQQKRTNGNPKVKKAK